jgi:hypothetical protein
MRAEPGRAIGLSVKAALTSRPARGTRGPVFDQLLTHMRQHVSKRTVTRYLAFAIALGFAGRAAAQTPGVDTVRQPSAREYEAADSIVLERGPCFGTCPVYRVSIARSGDVRFVFLHGADSGKVRQRLVDPDKFRGLVRVALFAHFFALPDKIEGPAYCPYPLTDLPSADVSLFMPNRQKTVADYGGCTWAPFILRSIETAIDEEADTRRWLH